MALQCGLSVIFSTLQLLRSPLVFSVKATDDLPIMFVMPHKILLGLFNMFSVNEMWRRLHACAALQIYDIAS